MRSNKLTVDEGHAPGYGVHPVPKPAALPHEALKRFRLVFRAVQQHSQTIEASCGVSNTQIWVLWELSCRPGMSVTELAKALAIHQSTASNLLDKLVKKGLVAKERKNQDQRVVSLSLTDAGRETLGKAPLPARGLLQQALFDLPDEVLRSLNDSLDALIEEMDVMDEQAAMQPIKPFGEKRAK